ncbi:ADP-ribose pyrophosphatase [Streptococcus dysgalactiae]|nr:ADP-ribose pyrophosphatase [Streptococcus dysgalactiae]
MAAAARELEEETQYKGDLELIYEFYTAIGFCNERIKLYVATNLKPVEIHVHLMMMSSLNSMN